MAPVTAAEKEGDGDLLVAGTGKVIGAGEEVTDGEEITDDE